MTINSREGYQCKQPQPQNVCVANFTRMIDYFLRFITLLGTYLQIAAATTYNECNHRGFLDGNI